MPCIAEIKSKGVLIDIPNSETIEIDGQIINKYDFYEYKGEEYSILTTEYENYKKLKDQEYKEKLDSQFTYTLDDYIGEDRANNIPKIKAYVSKFKTKYHKYSLYIWSNFNSTQKSTIARAIIKEIRTQDKNVSCEFILASTLLKDLKNEDWDSETKKKIEYYKGVDLLVIDDAFAKDKVTVYKSGYQLAFLDSFLRQRLEIDRKATIFTSNVALNKINTYFNKSIEALVKRTTYALEFNDVIGMNNEFEIDSIFDEVVEPTKRVR